MFIIIYFLAIFLTKNSNKFTNENYLMFHEMFKRKTKYSFIQKSKIKIFFKLKINNQRILLDYYSSKIITKKNLMIILITRQSWKQNNIC